MAAVDDDIVVVVVDVDAAAAVAARRREARAIADTQFPSDLAADAIRSSADPCLVAAEKSTVDPVSPATTTDAQHDPSPPSSCQGLLASLSMCISRNRDRNISRDLAPPIPAFRYTTFT